MNKRWIKKLRSEIGFNVKKTVSCRHIPMEILRVQLAKFNSDNITNCFEIWANITQDQFVLNIAKFGLTMEFAEVPVLVPTQQITFLGFMTDSVKMRINLTEERKQSIYTLC